MSAPQRLEHLDQVVDWLQSRLPPAALLCSDNRRLRAGDAFLAWPGQRQDGRRHVRAALQAGAGAVLVEAEGAAGFDWPADSASHMACYAGLQAAAGEIASRFYQQPSHALEVVAVTGTNGKTTFAWWLAHAWAQLGTRCGYAGTLGLGLPPALDDTGLTSPDALQLQAGLQHMRAQGAQACAIEASSIGLQQGRLNGTRIRVAVFTNLTQDHLDYHGSMQAYAQAKRVLFDWPGLEAAVVNAQDGFGQTLLAALQAQASGALDLWSYAVQAAPLPATPARLVARAVAFADGGCHFDVLEFPSVAAAEAATEPLQTVRVGAPITGLYNVQNLLALIATLRARGHTLVQAAQVCAQLPAVPGRMQMAGGAGQPLVVVDYAHTPDALRAALQALRPVAQQRGGRLQVLFGCGGDRDTSKRPLMAMAAAQHADAVWITSDNPRSEDPRAVIAQIETGLTPAQRAAARILPERRAAIATAVAQAAAADVVLVAGKGHETYQEIKGVKQPFSDLAEVHGALAVWRCQAPEVPAP